LLGGVIVYASKNVAHAQYTAASDLGKEVGALDAVFTTLISDVFAGKRYFDFGISTERAGAYLNEGLAENKQGFGARAVVYDFYELEI
jgi:hypothetical protein